MCEREGANRTRVAGHVDEIQGVVANTLGLLRNGAVGFIDLLDGVLACKTGFDDLQCPFRDIVADLDSVARSTSDLVSVVRGRVRNKLDPHAAVVGTLTRHFVWGALGNPNSVVAEIAIAGLLVFILPALVLLKLA